MAKLTQQIKGKFQEARKEIGGISSGGNLLPAARRQYYLKGSELAWVLMANEEFQRQLQTLEEHGLSERIAAGFDTAEAVLAVKYGGCELAEKFYNAGAFHTLEAFTELYPKLTNPSQG
jgi:hypothetical protein